MRDRIAATPLINFILAACALAVEIAVSRWGSLLNVIALVTLGLLLVVIAMKLVTTSRAPPADGGVEGKPGASS